MQYMQMAAPCSSLVPASSLLLMIFSTLFLGVRLNNIGGTASAQSCDTTECIPAATPDPSTPLTNTPPPPPPLTTSSKGNEIVGGVVGAIIIIVVAVVIWLLVRRRKRQRRAGPSDQHRGVSSSSPEDHDASSHYNTGPRRFSFEELHAATDNFSDSRLLGKGGFGSVYRGILADSTEVAVKRIAGDSKQGKKEYEAEITTIGNLRHRNLVKLKGWCSAGEGSFLLVYEYMANGSLDTLLFDNVLCAKLTWRRRWRLALGLGSALRYLHEDCDNIIIHRDVKSSNVLLDDSFNAKLGDFGLSRQMDASNTSHTTVLAGTRGYMGPELFIGVGRATRESDVFAFGAVLLEIVTGKRVLDPGLVPSHQGLLSYWVWDMYSQDKLQDVVDMRLELPAGNDSLDEAKKLLMVALACSHPDPKARPSIRRAMEALDGAAALPSPPLSRPCASYGPLRSMSISGLTANEQDSSEYSHHSQSTNPTTSSSNLYSGSSSRS